MTRSKISKIQGKTVVGLLVLSLFMGTSQNVYANEGDQAVGIEETDQTVDTEETDQTVGSEGTTDAADYAETPVSEPEVGKGEDAEKTEEVEAYSEEPESEQVEAQSDETVIEPETASEAESSGADGQLEPKAAEAEEAEEAEEAARLATLNENAYQPGIVELDGEKYLCIREGVLEKQAGTPVFNGKKYWVSEDGTLKTGWLYLGKWALYFDPESYEVKTGLALVGEKHYMFDENGVMQTYAGTTIVNGKKYWFTNDGSLGSGWLYLKKWALYFDPVTFEAKIGLAEVNGKHYMFDKNGVMQRYAGTTVVNGKKYWFTNDGSLGSGWLHLKKWALYFDPVTFEAKIGLAEVNGKHYMFDKNGVMQRYAGTTVVNGKKYWFQNDGSLGSGWLNLGSWKLYFDPVTYQAKTGYAQIDGTEYYFDQNGVLGASVRQNGSSGWKKTIVLSGLSGKPTKAYVWSAACGKDDLTQYSLTKNGQNWEIAFKSTDMKHSGMCYYEVYSGNSKLNSGFFMLEDRDFFAGLVTYGNESDIDFVRAAVNIAKNDAMGYGHTWPRTISCAGLVGLTLTHFGYGDFIKNDPLGWGYIDLGPEYENELTNVVGAACITGIVNRNNYTKLLPGDILYYYNSIYDNHIGYYIGNGWTVEARGPGGAQDRDETGSEIGLYYWPNDTIAFQKVYRIPNARIRRV